MLITLRVNIESVLFNKIACVADVIKHRVVRLRSSAYVLVDLSPQRTQRIPERGLSLLLVLSLSPRGSSPGTPVFSSP